jgi:hypothetical protein
LVQQDGGPDSIYIVESGQFSAVMDTPESSPQRVEVIRADVEALLAALASLLETS